MVKHNGNGSMPSKDENRWIAFHDKYHFRGINDFNKKLTAEETVYCFNTVVDVQLLVNMIHVFSNRLCTEV